MSSPLRTLFQQADALWFTCWLEAMSLNHVSSASLTSHEQPQSSKLVRRAKCGVCEFLPRAVLLRSLRVDPRTCTSGKSSFRGILRGVLGSRDLRDLRFSFGDCGGNSRAQQSGERPGKQALLLSMRVRVAVRLPSQHNAAPQASQSAITEQREISQLSAKRRGDTHHHGYFRGGLLRWCYARRVPLGSPAGLRSARAVGEGRRAGRI